MRVTLTDEVNMLAPHSVKLCFYAVVASAGGTNVNVSGTYNYTISKEETMTYKKEVIRETAAEINAGFEFGPFSASASLQTSLRTSTLETSSLTVNDYQSKSWNFTANPWEPVYIYQTEVTTMYKNGGETIQKSLFPTRIDREPVLKPCD